MLYTGLELYYIDSSVRLSTRDILFLCLQTKKGLLQLIQLLPKQVYQALTLLCDLVGRREPSSYTPILCSCASYTLGKHLTCACPRSLYLFPSTPIAFLYEVSNFLQLGSSLSYCCSCKRALNNYSFYTTSWLM